MLNVVVLNGGRGAAALIPALLSVQGINLTSVVNAYDDGKSTGEIRRFFRMLGPSDIRKVQELMLPENDPDHASSVHLFGFRFPLDADRPSVLAALEEFAAGTSPGLVCTTFRSSKINAALRRFVREFLDGLAVSEKVMGEQLDFSDCSIMNCVYAGAHLAFDRNIEAATRYIDRLFKLKGTVLPTSNENRKLVALRENGEMLYSEAEIVELRSNVRIERIYLIDEILDKRRFEALSLQEKRWYLERNDSYVEVSPGVKLALQQADIIVYSAGTQHSSLYPTYLSRGLAEAIADNRSSCKFFVTNIGADYETPSYLASDYIRGAHRYLNLSDGRDYTMEELFDFVLVNESHLKRGDTYVEFDEETFSSMPVRLVLDMFESEAAPGRHEGPKLVDAILSLYEQSSALA
ncbi:MAG: YvcK family protein [Burkholderiales bacterium]|nr:YvcK family protein [Burkholderiales bacterium]